MKAQQIGIVCTSTGFGGLEMNTLKLAQWLQDAGWQVRMLLNEQGETFNRAEAYCKDIASVQDIGEKTLNKPNATIIKQWLKENNVSILFTPYNKDIAALSNYKRFKNKHVKLVYQQHMKVGVKKRDLIHTLRYNMLDSWISPLQYLKQETIRNTRVPANKISIIPFGLEANKYIHNNITKAEARKQLNISENVPLIGLLGRIDPKKEQKFLIQAIDHLKKHYQLDYQLIIMGSVTPNEGDAYINSLNALVNGLGLQDKVHFRDFVADVAPFYKGIDVFAIPSSGETFGMVTIEAMASGCPIIGTNKDGTQELLEHGKLGYLYEYNDLDGFCKQLQSLNQNKQLAIMVQEAEEAVQHHYTKEVMCEKLNTLLYGLL
ncbi:MAG: glycosyltransferase family 4 protein [Bacteroidota bacterium]